MPVNTSGVTDAVDRLENAGHLDPVVHAVRKVVRSALPSNRYATRCTACGWASAASGPDRHPDRHLDRRRGSRRACRARAPPHRR